MRVILLRRKDERKTKLSHRPRTVALLSARRWIRMEDPKANRGLLFQSPADRQADASRCFRMRLWDRPRLPRYRTRVEAFLVA